MKDTPGKQTALRRYHWAITVVLAAVVFLASAPALSQSRGECALVKAPWPMALPDGAIHGAGTLTLCLQQMWTPSTGLHEVRVNGKSLGLFMSSVGASEGPNNDLPLVVFRREQKDEEFRLLGYAWPDGDVMRTFILREFGRTPRSAATEVAQLPLVESETTAILVALLPR